MKCTSREDFHAAFPGKLSFAQLLHFDMITVPTEDQNTQSIKNVQLSLSLKTNLIEV